MRFSPETANLDDSGRGISPGAHISTMRFQLIKQLFKQPLTDIRLQNFLKNWEKARETLGDVFDPAAARMASH